MRPLRIFQAVISSVIVVHLISRVLDRKEIFDDAKLNEFGYRLRTAPCRQLARKRRSG